MAKFRMFGKQKTLFKVCGKQNIISQNERRDKIVLDKIYDCFVQSPCHLKDKIHTPLTAPKKQSSGHNMDKDMDMLHRHGRG